MTTISDPAAQTGQAAKTGQPAQTGQPRPTAEPAQSAQPSQPGLSTIEDAPATSTGGRARTLAWLITKRLGSALLVLWIAVTLTFLAVHIAPGDTVSLLLGENRDDPIARAQVISRWGLDQPIWSQYLTYLGRIPSGDLGVSYTLRRPVAELLAQGAAPTLILTFAATVTSLLIALVATLINTAPVRGLRAATSGIQLVVLSLPPFWLAILLLTVVSFGWGWFSIVDQNSWQALVLPTLALAIPMGFYLTQVLSDGVFRAIEQPFAVTARSRGLGPAAVRYRHAFRHAALPAVHLVGLSVGGLLGGAVIVEQIFGRPGLGQLAVSAVTVKDVPLILGVTLVSTAAFIAASTVVDLIGIVLDPRLRRTQGAPA
ncbi:MAG: ABC transporter permease [Bifidobacteriaceae bacterium]|jgi:peptide/nickel transport system permease protein|nr:ABC transporter permease [Bifidobacteriaceae bacterium]